MHVGQYRSREIDRSIEVCIGSPGGGTAGMAMEGIVEGWKVDRRSDNRLHAPGRLGCCCNMFCSHSSSLPPPPQLKLFLPLHRRSLSLSPSLSCVRRSAAEIRTVTDSNAPDAARALDGVGPEVQRVYAPPRRAAPWRAARLTHNDYTRLTSDALIAFANFIPCSGIHSHSHSQSSLHRDDRPAHGAH